MFDLTKVDDISILHLYGEISLLEIERIQEILKSLKKNHHNKILIDLAKVDYVHFKAVHQWAAEALSLRSLNGDLKLIQPNQQAQHVLKFTGADQFLKDYVSMGDAVLSFLDSPLVYADGFQKANTYLETNSEKKDAQQTKEGDPEIVFH